MDERPLTLAGGCSLLNFSETLNFQKVFTQDYISCSSRGAEPGNFVNKSFLAQAGLELE
jgi:hypothetical protein